MVEHLSRAERIAVEKHRIRLASESGSDVDLAEALADWMEHHSLQWRKERHSSMMAMEREEILRHKWIESEKRNRDMGSEAAFDWIRRYAAVWRQWFEENYEAPETR